MLNKLCCEATSIDSSNGQRVTVILPSRMVFSDQTHAEINFIGPPSFEEARERKVNGGWSSCRR